ncbi:unnamed protein product [Closterium sp. NIES-54]
MLGCRGLARMLLLLPLATARTSLLNISTPTATTATATTPITATTATTTPNASTTAAIEAPNPATIPTATSATSTASTTTVGATLRFAFGLLSVCVHACGMGVAGVGVMGGVLPFPSSSFRSHCCRCRWGGGCEGVGEPGEWHWSGWCETNQQPSLHLSSLPPSAAPAVPS